MAGIRRLYCPCKLATKFILARATCDFFQQRVNEAFSMYCDDEDTGKKVVFDKEHVEGMNYSFSTRANTNIRSCLTQLTFIIKLECN